ncbi:MAG: hypothetical protein Edafosvirus10_34 [Edafosvirus sp.]|uniref:tRNA carboxymethyluridine synthase n=1 Tax=Edafosvirus sp. TaxID=2487765 RepID=A0A3G4ZY85_9VIRU|nr:MAG: hypothetical protein Edafosvirus10_34 [Edafosvirus sp.]
MDLEEIEETRAEEKMSSCSTKKRIVDIENIVIQKPMDFINDKEIMDKILDEILLLKIDSKQKMETAIKNLRKKYHIGISNVMVLYSYRMLCRERNLKYDPKYEEYLQSKTFRSQSGVMVIAVFTSPYPNGQTFSCEYDCYYCPNEKDQPRSYLLKEPGVLRANKNGFDCVRQFWDRANAYIMMGHPVDKVELLVLGGTWSSYPESYQEEFIRDTFYAANTYYDINRLSNPRVRLSYREEMKINETSSCRIIGITLETRPDRITAKELQRFREFGVTRVQIGVQHIDDRILYRVNRGCKSIHTIRAIKLMKDNCFKIDIHLMPDLPKPLKPNISNKKEKFEMEDIDHTVDMVDLDEKMFNTILNNPEWQVDQWKIYPCTTVPWTRIEDEYKRKIYVPYGETVTKEKKNPLFELLLRVKCKVHPWIRLNRVIRDIPNNYILGGNSDTNMRQYLQNEMIQRGLKCSCIRCREVKKTKIDPAKAILKVRKYKASDADEYFISFETDEKTPVLFGFLRLRLSLTSGLNRFDKPVFPELVKCALIRELHVYGQVVPVSESGSGLSQHYGFGTKLVEHAFRISIEKGFNKIAVISGVGVKDYYRKFGFEDENNFMTKIFDEKEIIRIMEKREVKQEIIEYEKEKTINLPVKTSSKFKIVMTLLLLIFLCNFIF